MNWLDLPTNPEDYRWQKGHGQHKDESFEDIDAIPVEYLRTEAGWDRSVLFLLRENMAKYVPAALFWPNDSMCMLDAAKPSKWKSCSSMAPSYSKVP